MTGPKLRELCDDLDAELKNAKAGLDKNGDPFKWKDSGPSSPGS